MTKLWIHLLILAQQGCVTYRLTFSIKEYSISFTSEFIRHISCWNFKYLSTALCVLKDADVV